MKTLLKELSSEAPPFEKLNAPFPWFGGKRRVAAVVWERFGDVGNYVEPFAGSLAILLNRPHPPRVETVNDLDCYLANFWRALQADPSGVALLADWPVNEADLHARHRWLHAQTDFREKIETKSTTSIRSTWPQMFAHGARRTVTKKSCVLRSVVTTVNTIHLRRAAGRSSRGKLPAATATRARATTMPRANASGFLRRA